MDLLKLQQVERQLHRRHGHTKYARYPPLPLNLPTITPQLAVPLMLQQTLKRYLSRSRVARLIGGTYTLGIKLTHPCAGTDMTRMSITQQRDGRYTLHGAHIRRPRTVYPVLHWPDIELEQLPAYFKRALLLRCLAYRGKPVKKPLV